MFGLNNIQEKVVPNQIDPKALAELKAIVAETKRESREKGIKHWGFIVLLGVGFIGVSVIIICKVLHLVLPDAHKWLSKEQLSQMDTFLTSNLIGGGIVGIYKSKIGSINN